MAPRVAALALALAFAATTAPATAAERIDHAGRILPALIDPATPLVFDTPQADAAIAAMQIVPRDSAWVEDVSHRPVAANSTAMMTRIAGDIAAKGAGRQNLRVFWEMNYVVAPSGQPSVDILFDTYPDQSDGLKPGSPDVGSWPIPANTPVETWPRGRPAGETLSAWQVGPTGEDRHAIIVQPWIGQLWETWQMRWTTGGWVASNGARFDLTGNALRPDRWTSGDAAGLAMFPALVRYDECVRGSIDHACRIVVARSRSAHLYPATHDAGSTTDPDTPAMGQRLRLKQGFAIPGSWEPYSQMLARALQKYGALVADNGGFLSISATPDDRFPSTAFRDAQTIPISAFEVVVATGATTGPRSPGAPTCDAGSDRVGTVGVPVALDGSVTGSGAFTTWYLYDRAAQPGTVSFGNNGSLATTATFSAAGTYTVMLEADDSIHTPAYDAVVVTVTAAVGTTTGGTTTGGTTTGGTTTAGTVTSGTTTGGSTGGGGGGCGHGAGAVVGLALALSAALRRQR